MTDNVAVLAGYTEQYHCSDGTVDLLIMIKPGTDTESRFKAWDCDEQEYLLIKGWLVETMEQIT